MSTLDPNLIPFDPYVCISLLECRSGVDSRGESHNCVKESLSEGMLREQRQLFIQDFFSGHLGFKFLSCTEVLAT